MMRVGPCRSGWVVLAGFPVLLWFAVLYRYLFGSSASEGIAIPVVVRSHLGFQPYPYNLTVGLPAYLSLWELPLRKLGLQAREVTSYNTEGYNYDYGNYLY
eukprot:RCo047856